eukprot:364990-Chlamydomonas_euryale.AAC.10
MPAVCRERTRGHFLGRAPAVAARARKERLRDPNSNLLWQPALCAVPLRSDQPRTQASLWSLPVRGVACVAAWRCSDPWVAAMQLRVAEAVLPDP